MQKQGLLVLLTGPSGVGKKTVWSPILKNKKLALNFSVSMTTRNKREGEVEGKDYFFVSKKEFKKAIKEKKLLEHAKFAGNYYGTPADYVNKLRSEGKNVMLEIEPKGGLQVLKIFKKNNDDGIVSIFISPPTLEDLKKRLLMRNTESLDTIKKRIKKAKWEISKKSHYKYQIVSYENKENEATQKLLNILLSEIKNYNERQA